MSGEPLTVGSAAKLYCLELLEQRIAATRAPFTVLDVGCGDARDLPVLLRRHPDVRYVGVDPSREACERARRTLAGLRAGVVQASGYELALTPADAVLCFGVLQNVRRRLDFLRRVRAHVADGGVVFLTVDSGHLAASRVRRAARTLAALASPLAGERHYWARLRDAELRELLRSASLAVRDEKLFNTGLKDVYHFVPEHGRSQFMRRWLELELELNRLGIEYRDELATVFRTRCFVLERD